MANFWERDLATATAVDEWWLGDIPAEEEEVVVEETPFWQQDEPVPEGDDIYSSFGQDAFNNPVEAESSDVDAIDLVGGRVTGLGAVAQSMASFANEITGDVAKAAKSSYEYITTDLGEDGGRTFWDVYNQTSGDIGSYKPHDEAAAQQEKAKFNRQLQREAMPENETGKFMVELADSAIMMVPSLLVGGLPGVTANTALTVMGAQVYTTTYVDQLNEGKGKDEAHTEAMYQTLWEMGPEKASGFYDNLGIGAGFKAWSAQAGREAVSEVLTENLNILDEHFRKGEAQATFAEYIKRNLHALAAGFALGGGLQTGTMFREEGPTETDRINLRIEENDRIDAERTAQEGREQGARDAYSLDTEVQVETGGVTEVAAPIQIEGLTPIPQIEQAETDADGIPAALTPQDIIDRMDAQAERFDALMAALEPKIDAEIPQLPGDLYTPPTEQEYFDNADTPEMDLPQRPTGPDVGFDETVRDISEPPAPVGMTHAEMYERTLDIDTMTEDDILDEIGEADSERYMNAATPQEAEELIEDFRAELKRQATNEYKSSSEQTTVVDIGQKELDQADEFARANEQVEREKQVEEETARAKTLDENRELAVLIADRINTLGVGYTRVDKARRKKAGLPENEGWRIIAVEPSEQRVYAEYIDANNETYQVSWIIGESLISPVRTAHGALMRTNTTKGADRPAKGARPRKDVSGEIILREGGGVPFRFRKEVDKMAAAALATRDGVVTAPARVQSGKRAISIPMQGAQPQRLAIMEAEVEAEKDYKNNQRGKYEAIDEDKIAAVRAQAREETEGAQDRVVKFIRSEIVAQVEAGKNRNIDRAERDAAEAYKEGKKQHELSIVELDAIKAEARKKAEKESKNPSVAPKFIPPYSADRGAKVVTLMDTASANRLRNNTTVKETAVQVLPDGSLRSISIELNEAKDAYIVVALARGANKFEGSLEDRTMGTAAIKVDTAKVTQAQERSASPEAARAALTKREMEEREEQIEKNERRAFGYGATAPAVGRAARSIAGMNKEFGEGTINIDRAQAEVEDRKSSMVRLLDGMVKKFKQRANDPDTGKFMSMSAHELAARTEQIATLLRAKSEKTLTDKGERTLDTELYESGGFADYFNAVARINARARRKAESSKVTEEDIKNVWQQEDLDLAHEGLRTRLADLTERERMLIETVPDAAVRIEKMMKKGIDWATALDAVQDTSQGTIDAAQADAAAAEKSESLKEQKLAGKRQKAESESAAGQARRLETQLARRGRLRPTEEPAEADDAISRTRAALEDELARDRRVAAREASENTLELKNALKLIEENTETSSKERAEQKEKLFELTDEMKRLAVVVEADKAKAQAETAREAQRKEAAEYERLTGLKLSGEVSTRRAQDDKGRFTPELDTRIPEDAQQELPLTVSEEQLKAPKIPTKPTQPAEQPIIPIESEKQITARLKREAKAKQAQAKKDKAAATRLRNKLKKENDQIVWRMAALRRFEDNVTSGKVDLSQTEYGEVTVEDVWYDTPAGQETDASLVKALMAELETLASEETSSVELDGAAVDAAHTTLDLKSEDKVAKTLWYNKNFLHPKIRTVMRRLHSRVTRRSGLSKKNRERIVVDRWQRMLGGVRALEQEFMDSWNLLQGELRSAGWGYNMTEEQARTIRGYMSGMSLENAAEAYGVTVPATAIPHLDKMKSTIKTLGRVGAREGAFSGNVVLAIDNGRPYLHMRGLRGHVGRIRQMIPGMRTPRALSDAELDMLTAAAKEAWVLPVDGEIDELTPGKMRSLINKYSVYTRTLHTQVEKGTKNVIRSYVDENGNRIQLFRASAENPSTPLKKGWIAQPEQIRAYMHSVGVDDVSYRNMVRDTMESIIGFDRPRGKKQAQLAADASIQRQRTILKSDRDIIRKILGRVKQGVNKKDLAGLSELKLRVQQRGYDKMEVNQFIEAFTRDFPQHAALMQKTAAEHKLNMAMRQVLEEVIDPRSVIGDTVTRLANTVYLTKYLNDIASVGVKEGWMAEVTGQPTTGMVRLADPGTPLGDSTFNHPTQGHTKTSDVYVNEQVRIALQELTGLTQREHGNIVKTAYIGSSLAKYGMIILNPIAHPRNFVSTSMIHLGNGGWLGWLNSDFSANRFAVEQLRESRGRGAAVKVAQNRKPKIKWLARQAALRGLLHDGGKSGAMEDLLRATGTAEETADVVSSLHHGSHRLNQEGVLGGARRAGRSIKDIHDTAFRLEDEAVKASAFLMQTRQNLYLHTGSTELLERAQNGERLSKEEQHILGNAMDVAAENVLQTYPTFSRAAPWVQNISRLPVIGAFPTFSAEMIRTTYNQYKYSANLMAGKTSDGKRVPKEQRLAARLLGAHNMAMKTASIAMYKVMAGALYGLAQGFMDDDDEYVDPKAELSNVMPTYESGGTNMITDVNADTGRFEYMVLDYLNPYGAWEKAISENYTEWMELRSAGDPNDVVNALNAVWGATISDVLMNDEVVFGNVIKRMQNERSTISYDRDAAMTKAGDYIEEKVGGLIRSVTGSDPVADSLGAAAGVAMELFPGGRYVDIATSAVKELQKAGDDASLTTADAIQTGLWKFAGIKERKYNFDEDFSVNTRRHLTNLKKAQTRMQDGLVRGDAKTYEEFALRYGMHNAQRYVEFDNLYKSTRTARDVLGRNSYQVQRELGIGGLTNETADITINDIMVGHYTPLSRAKFDELIETATKAGDSSDRTDDITPQRARQLREWFDRALAEEDYQL